MSSVQCDTYCPICQSEDAETYNNTYPFELVTITCQNCGFVVTPHLALMDFNELNEYRKDQELKPITKREYNKYKKEFNSQFKS